MAKIVFVEDDPMIQKLVRSAFRSRPDEIHFASDGVEGLALIRRERPDIVFTDIAMPGMDGLQLREALRADAELARIPVVFMTASVQRWQIERALAQGAAGVLAKPFTMSDLRARVDELARDGD